MSELELREVRGPSALGGGWRRSAELLYLIAVTEFKRTYLGTALGYLWSIARPLMLFGVLLAVFTQVFRLGSEVPHYPVLLLFYASPVLYPLEKVPATLRDVIMINPLAPLLELARKWVIDPTAPGPAALAGGYAGLLPAVAVFVLVCVAAVWVFKREAPRIAEEL